ncbi:MAG: hypothetical protein R3B45_14595 [Bdellovibrionota bacterium]
MYRVLLGRVDVSFPTTSQTLESQRCHDFKNYPQCTSSTPPVIFETLPSCDFQVFFSRYENETSTRPNYTSHIGSLSDISLLASFLLYEFWICIFFIFVPRTSVILYLSNN